MHFLRNIFFTTSFSFALVMGINFTSLAADPATTGTSVTINGYKLESTKVGSNINCYDKNINNGKGGGNESICQKYFSGKGIAKCQAVESTLDNSTKDPVYACNTDEKTFCHRDSDCIDVPGRPTCIIGLNGNTQKFDSQFSQESDIDSSEKFGICSSVGGSSDRNSISMVLCRVINLITGGAGKAVCVIVVSVVGVMFFLGKVQWSLLLSVGGGVAFIFGAKTIIKVIVGGELIC